MMYSSAWFSLTLLGLSSFVHSFPTANHIARLNPTAEELHKALVRIQENKAKRQLLGGLLGGLTGSSGSSNDSDGSDGSNTKWKATSVTGEHAFQAPNFAAGDQRGPCPGLNALANHGYLSRDGVTSLADTIVAVNDVFGMGGDLATLIALMGTVYAGNPLSLEPGFSIGGETDKVSNILDNLFGLLGKPRGLDASHNFIESDASLTRDDIYLTGDASSMNMTRFLEIYNGATNGVVTFDQVGATIERRFEDSKARNPNFYSGPYSGMIARNAGYAFGLRLLSNHSDEFPQGQLSLNVLKSMWAVYDDSSQPSGLVYKRGHEQIPENWYRIQEDYTLIHLNLDLVNWYLDYPQTLAIGGNTGTVNSFVGVDFGDITGGLLNATSLLESNNLLCFVLEIVKTFAPNSLSTLFKILEGPLELITSTLAAPLLSLACPEWKDLTTGANATWGKLLEFPGASKAGTAL